MNQKLSIPIGEDGDENASFIANSENDDNNVSEAGAVEKVYRNKPRWHPPWQLRQVFKYYL